MTNMNQSQFCDLTIEQAVAHMMQRTGDMTLVVDRMFTFAAAQACMDIGADKTASMMHYMIAHVEAGAFDYLGKPDPDDQPYQEPTEDEIRAGCTKAILATMEQMLTDGATMAMVIEKLLTAASVASVREAGSFKAATLLRTYADLLDAGAMAMIEPTDDSTAH
ncbi:hypothetical protein [Loktanella sp. R86503]|uniref:hypothetical protein n=1 Tax=Loktanella sp. R86503 TaxID=3093847 RepID=UPI0036DCC57C